jgi:glucose-6-phosphate 1-dehydrogenase
MFYCQGDLTDAAAYKKLEEKLTSFGSGPLRENLLFYLATQPSQFGEVIEQIHAPVCCTRTAARAGSASSWRNRSATISPPRRR